MKIMGSIDLLKKIYDKLLIDVAKKYDLTVIELKILVFLDNNKSNVSKDVVDGIRATKSHVSMSVCDLEQKGYIEKIQDEVDKKKCHLQLTKKSLKVIQDGKNAQNKIKEIMLKDVTIKELEMLENIGKKIKSNLEDYNKNN